MWLVSLGLITPETTILSKTNQIDQKTYILKL